jgi:hypothetical protein
VLSRRVIFRRISASHIVRDSLGHGSFFRYSPYHCVDRLRRLSRTTTRRATLGHRIGGSLGHSENLPASTNALNVLLAGEAVAIGLGLLLVCWYPLIDRVAYRIGFFLGLAAFAAILFGLGGQWDSRSHPVLFPSFLPFKFSLIHATFLAMTPYLLLLESGIAGYRGFSSWMRYASLALTVLGTFGLLAAFLLPRWLRRHRTVGGVQP